jgi:hypothetical protein
MRVDVDITRAISLTPEVRDAIHQTFQYQKWEQHQVERGELVRDACAAAVVAIVATVMPSPERTRAINHIVDARMLANAAITFEP